ncbi:MAG: hypothetical protein ACOY0T_01950 [Myxococcota bacterium]
MRRTSMAVGLCGVLALSCTRLRAVAFQGHSLDMPVRAGDVVETSVIPRGASWLGRVVARCHAFTPGEAFEDRALFDLDCTEARLRSLLRQGAAEAGGNVLSEVVCNSSSTRECRALVSSLPRSELSHEPPTPTEPELRESVGNARVAFVPSRTGAVGPARASALVSEQPYQLPSHRMLGCLKVRCEGCSELEARDALRVAAARLGGSGLVSPHCASLPSGSECVAELAKNEQD